MKEELCIVDLTVDELFDNRVFFVSFEHDDEVILGCFRRVNTNGFIHWVLIVFDEKYSSMFDYNDSLLLVGDKIYDKVLERYKVELDIIES